MKTSAKQQEHIAWIKEYMRQEPRLDVMNSKFVDDFEERFKCPVHVSIFGPNRCPDLGKALSAGYKQGIFDRKTVGLVGGAWHVGFPRWVYVYELNKASI